MRAATGRRRSAGHNSGPHPPARIAFEMSEDSIDEVEGEVVINSGPRTRLPRSAIDPLMDSIQEVEVEDVLPGTLAGKPIQFRPSAQSVIEMSEFSIDEVEKEVVIHSPGKLRACIGGSPAPRPLCACAMLWTAARFAVDVSTHTSRTGSGGLSSFHVLVLPLLVIGAMLLPRRVRVASSAALMAYGLSRAMSQPTSAGQPFALGALMDLSLLRGLGVAVERRLGCVSAGSRRIRHAHRYSWRSLASIPGTKEELAVLAVAIGLAAAGWACGTALAWLRPG
eukprot:scaffold8996_cov101-Isochrysis_galbana.AAC.2